MKLYVDDVRPCPPGWRLARTVAEAKELLAAGVVETASLDHDMGACAQCIISGASIGDMQTPETTFVNWCPHAEDGTTLIAWMEETGYWPPHKPHVHSLNPVGRARMRAAIDRHYGEATIAEIP